MIDNKRRTRYFRYLFIFTVHIGVAFILSGCASRPPVTSPSSPKPYRVDGKWYQPMADAKDFRQRGIASWYGRKFHGRKTSNGEIYDMYAVSAAHKTLPLGTWVEVRHLENGKTLTVRINDRGPFVRGRIIDLSYAAAKELDIVGPGTGPVEVVALGVAREERGGRATYVPGDYYSGNFTFQVGAFTNRDNAERLRGQLARQYANAHITVYEAGWQTFYRVRVGKCSELTEAMEFEEKLIATGYPQAFIVAE